MQKRQETVVNGSSGRPVVGATVTVTTLAGVAATLYTSNGAGLISGNSVTTDDNGLYFYYAADGRYSETISGSGITTTVITDILIDDSLDGVQIEIATDSIASRFYRADATFSGTVNPGTLYGYNITGFGQIESAAKSSLLMAFESNYNDGSVRYLEMHWDMAGPGQSYVRPMQINYALTGADANKVTDISFTSGKNIHFLASSGDINITASTLTFAGTAAHTGTFAISSKLFLTSSSDDSSSVLQAGVGDQAAGTRTTISLRPGGFAAPSAANAQSNGDKFLLWNGTTFKGSVGLESGAMFFQANGSSATNGFKWYGTTSATPAEQMRLAASGDFYTRSTGSELATSATDGFAHIPTCNGTPTGVPANLLTGASPIIINRANNKLYFYSGGAWRDAGP